MPNMLRFIPLLFVFLALAVPAAPLIHHDLQVRLEPDNGTLTVIDNLRFGRAMGHIIFSLHEGLSPRVKQGRARLASLGSRGAIERFALIPAEDEKTVTLTYAGSIRHQLTQVDESLGRSHRRSSGTIGPDGVFLDGTSAWYPWIADTLQSFDLAVDLPSGWLAVSQGEGPAMEDIDGRLRVRWSETLPQDDIYLIAAPFELYRNTGGSVEAQVYLRRPDPALAKRYLDLTRDYLALYSDFIGPYPYAKFALVENFWETGYGMPSFTLLGPRVIRLPFIPYTSYPHEVLHNWWGNGVYVDYDSGNWSEGLTTYLADHLLKERRGKAAGYRRDALRRFADFVNAGKDFPLRRFRSRHSGASQSVGYGKGFMFFHMLRRELGNEVFIAGLRAFYLDNRFKTAGYEQLRIAFEQAADRDLSAFFQQWLERSGAPRLALDRVTSEQTANGYRLHGRIRQTQDDNPFRLRLPLVVYLEGGAIERHALDMDTAELPFELELPARPLRLDLDPRFDLFRGLYPEESPPTLGALFGADEGLILVPESAPPALRDGYRKLAEQWTRGHAGWEIRSDRSLDGLPDGRAIWLLGWDNRFLPALTARWKAQGVEMQAGGMKLEGRGLDRVNHSLVLTTAGEDPETQPLAWLGAHDPTALPGLARKLPHYGKYGILAFEGEGPSNVLKAQWPVLTSPLSVLLDSTSASFKTEPTAPLF